MAQTAADWRSDASLRRLVRWCQKNGALGGPIAPAEFADSGRGFCATRDVAAGEMLLAIPERLLLSHASARRRPGLAELVDCRCCGGPLAPETMLALHLLLEVAQAAGSPYAAYVASLPHTYDTPLHWSLAEVDALPDESERAAALATRAAVDDERRAVLTRLERHADELGEGLIQLRELLRRGSSPGPAATGTWTWAWSTVMTRTMFVPEDCGDDGGGGGDGERRSNSSGAGASGDCALYRAASDRRQCYALVPLADLFNHSSAKCDAGFNRATGMYEFRAPRAYRRGDEVCLCYGFHTNAQLLLQYGFCLAANPADATPLRPAELGGASADTRLGSALSAELTDRGLDRALAVHADGPSWALLATARAMHGARDVASVGAVVSAVAQGMPLADVDAEVRAWAAVRSACQRRLDAMGGSQLGGPAGAVEEGPGCAARLRSALRLHLSERRRLLLAAIDAARASEHDTAR